MLGRLPFAVQNLDSFVDGCAAWWSVALAAGRTRKLIGTKPRNANLLAPRGHAKAYPINRNNTVKSCVAGLLNWQFPSAVGGLVIAVVVNPAYRMDAGRLTTNIGDKVLETVAPAFADGNAPSAVIFVLLVVMVIAAKLQLSPSLVLRRARQAMFNYPVLVSHFCCRFFGKASAAKGAGADVGGCDDGVITAVTKTIPKCIPSFGLRGHLCYNGEAAKLLALKVFPAHYLSFSHTGKMH